MFSHKSNDLDLWIEKTSKLKISALDSYISGLQHDIAAIKMELTTNTAIAFPRAA